MALAGGGWFWCNNNKTCRLVPGVTWGMFAGVRSRVREMSIQVHITDHRKTKKYLKGLH